MMTANRIFCVVPANEQFGASTVPLLAPVLEGRGGCDQRAVMGAFCSVWFTLITTGQANEARSTRPRHTGSCLNSASPFLALASQRTHRITTVYQHCDISCHFRNKTRRADDIRTRLVCEVSSLFVAESTVTSRRQLTCLVIVCF